MFYGTGGFAYGGGSRHFDVFDSLNGWDWNGNGGSKTRTGWTLGAGVEYAITNNITIKGEYLYYNLGSSRHCDLPPIRLPTSVWPASYATREGQLRRLDRPRRRQLQVLIASLGASRRMKGRPLAFPFGCYAGHAGCRMRRPAAPNGLENAPLNRKNAGGEVEPRLRLFAGAEARSELRVVTAPPAPARSPWRRPRLHALARSCPAPSRRRSDRAPCAAAAGPSG